MAKSNRNKEKVKSMESWIWDAACSIRGAQDAPKYKDFILPLIFVKRLCDVFDDEIDRIAEKVKSRTKALQLADNQVLIYYGLTSLMSISKRYFRMRKMENHQTIFLVFFNTN